MKLPSNHHHVCLAVVAGCAVLLEACTVRPKVVTTTQASFDGNEQNSGLLAIDAAGNRVITPHAHERYNALMERYGTKWNPPVKAEEGIRLTATNTFLIDRQHWFYFETANRWRKQEGRE